MIVNVWEKDTEAVTIVNVPVVEPPAMTRFEGAGIAPRWPSMMTFTPPGGAGPESVTVPGTVVPPVTDVEDSTTD